MLTVGSLFSGIGGFDLGFERAGMRTVWFCEQDPFCQRVLAKHWPGVPCYPDVRALVADASGAGRRQDVRGAYGDEAADEGWPALDADESRGGSESDGCRGVLPVSVPYVDVLCGGFPCQDISVAGRGEGGIDGARSGLWAEYARLVRELRPRYVVVENVSALLHRGLDRVLGDLAACGYDAEWDCIPASAVGAPHRRDRVWLVAYPNGEGESYGSIDEQAHGGPQSAHGHDMADADIRRRHAGHRSVLAQIEAGREPSDASGRQPESRLGLLAHGLSPHAGVDGPWDVAPDIARVATGVPNRVNQLRALGNALVPQIAEWIGRRIVQFELDKTA